MSSRFVPFVISAAAMCTSCVLGAIDPDARARLDAIVDAYHAHEHVQGVMSTSVKSEMMSMEMETTFAISQPNRVAMRMESEEGGDWQIISDGITLTTFIHFGQSPLYVQSTAPETIKGVMDHEEVGVVGENAGPVRLIMQMMSGEGMDEFIKESVTGLTHHGIEDGLERFTITLKSSNTGEMQVEVPTDFFFDAETLALVRVVPDLSRLPLPSKIDAKYEFPEMTFGEVPEAGTFTFDAPEGSVKIATFRPPGTGLAPPADAPVDPPADSPPGDG